jgi:small-conductance mechanosensitive channel
MPFWHRLVIVGGVILASAVIAKVIDLRMARKKLAPGAETRYRVLRRSIMTAVVFVGILSSLLVIPQVRAIAGGILASSAIVGLVVGFASQRTLANFAAGLLIAFTQPLRIGDRVSVEGIEGTVEEIDLTYTFVRADDNTRLVIPNEKLASDTIRNSSIVSRETLAQVTVQVPLDTDLAAAVDLLRDEVSKERQPSAFVSALAERATITLRAWAPSEREATQLEADLLLRAHARLRSAGIYA